MKLYKGLISSLAIIYELAQKKRLIHFECIRR